MYVCLPEGVAKGEEDEPLEVGAEDDLVVAEALQALHGHGEEAEKGGGLWVCGCVCMYM
jgi:hypothetical protein